MSASKTYRQCRLRRDTEETTAWIETRGAEVGKRVEVKPAGELWEVVEVFAHTLDETMLREHQQMHRNSLPSVEGMAR